MSNKLAKQIILIGTGLVLVLVAVVSSGLTLHSGHIRQDVQVTAKIKASSVLTSSELPSSAQASSVRATVHVKNLDAKGNAWLALWRIPSLIIAFIVVLLIVETTFAIANGDAFVSSNIIRLRILAIVLVLTAIVKLVGDYAHQKLIAYSPVSNFHLMPVSISYAPALVGIAMFFVAEAFVAGKKAVESTEGLI